MRLHILPLTGAPAIIEISPDVVRSQDDELALAEPILGGAGERIRVLFKGAGAIMYALADRSSLPRNEAATAVLRAAWLSQRDHEDPERMPDVRGPAVVFEGVVS